MAICSFCGFLTVRGVNGDFIEVDDQYRHSALPHLASKAHTGQADALALPLCFMQKHNLPIQILSQPEWGTDNRFAMLKTIASERDCDGWTKWQQGFTPKEHREMIDREKFREWQEKRNADDRRWRWIQAAVFGLLGGAVALIAALIGRS